MATMWQVTLYNGDKPRVNAPNGITAVWLVAQMPEHAKAMPVKVERIVCAK